METVGVPRTAGTRVWIDDRHPVFRRGLAACLGAAGFTVVGESAGFDPFPPPGACDILVFDAGPAGLRSAIRVAADGTRLVALVRQANEQLLSDIIDAGVGALLLHAELTVDRLTATVHAAACGTTTLPAGLLRRLLARAALGSTGHRAGLVDREIDVLRLLADGGDTRQIAADLCYSERTVKNIVHDVLTKMNCRNRAHAVATATRHGII